jgi:hypothetical protein
MLWYKSWLETRWRFLIGLGLLMLSACGIVLFYPEVKKLMPLVPTIDTNGVLGRRIREAAELQREFRGYVWSQWFRQTPTQIGTLFAVLLGSGNPLSSGSEDAALFTLSLPASRHRLIAVRAGTGLAELFALAFIPSLLIPLLSPAVGESYGIGSALVHGLCLFTAGAVFFSLALLLSTVFGDLWRPLMLACAVAVILGLAEIFLRSQSAHGIFWVMSGESFFRRDGVPWAGLLIAAALSASMLYAAAVNLARRDF